MKCRRSEELWSEYLEGTLPRPLVKDADEHFASCTKCQALYSVFREVVDEIHRMPRPEPGTDIVERIAARTPLRRAVWSFGAVSLPSWRTWAGLAAAAALFFVFFGTPKPLADFGRRANNVGHQTYSWGIRLYRTTDRILDELTVLRMTVGVAFEDRLDRLNERLRDLQKAQQKNRESQPPSGGNQGSSLLLSRESNPTSPLRRSWS